MQILSVDRIKNATIVALAIIAGVLYFDSRELRGELRRIETSYTKFLAKKSGGRQLYTLVNQASLGVFPVAENEAIVCGKIETRRGP